MSLLSNSVTAKYFTDFDPRTIPDCVIWFDAADLSTIGTALDGFTVKTWRNKGSISMNAVESTGTVTSVNFQNGRNYLSFPVGSEMRFTCALLNQAKSFFAVARNKTQLNASTFWGPINQTAGGGQFAGPVFTYVSSVNYSMTSGPAGVVNTVVSSVTPNPFETLNVYTLINSSTSTASNVFAINGLGYTLSTSSLAASYSTASLAYTINRASYNTALDICEIIHYDREVTLVERKSIEGYLAWKWGIQTEDEVGFTPTDISGCLAWYDADVDHSDATSRATSFTFSTGNLISTWKDKSGNGRDATFYNSSPSTTRPTLQSNIWNTKAGVAFGGASALSSTLSIGSTSPFTLFLVAATSTTDAAFRTALTINARPATRGNLLSVYKSASNLWWFSGGNGATDGNTTSVPVAIGRYDILSFYWSPTLRTQMNINGQYIPSSTSSPSSLIANSTLMIGSAMSAVIGSQVPAEMWNGGILEIIIYSGLLTTLQRNRVERYLSLKWRRPLTNTLLTYHPNKLALPFQREFQPVDINNCALWLDGSDNSTFTFSSGNNIATWLDKSGNGNNGTVTGTVTNLGSINGVQATNWTQTTNVAGGGVATYIRGAMSLYESNPIDTAAVMTVFAVFRMNSTSATNARLIALGVTGTSELLNTSYTAAMMRSSTTSTFLAIRNNVNQSGPASSTVVNVDNVACSQFNGATHTMYVNGTASASVGTSVLNFSIQNYQLGNGFAVENNFWYNGTIGEIIVYASSLTSSERQKVEGYLADKWRLRDKLPSNHPSVYGTSITDISNFNPTTSISGCQLWLDASDISTINGGSITGGGSVSSWSDKSGNSIVVPYVGITPLATWDYSLNKLPTIITTNRGFLGSFVNPLTNFRNTTFIVGQLNSNPTAGFPCVTFGNTNSSATRYLRPLDWATNFRTIGFFSNVPIATITPPTNGTPFLWTSVYDGSTSMSASLNSGVTTATASPSPIAPGADAGFFGIGLEQFTSNSSAASTWPGHISEVIVYNTDLSATERARVEEYLANKWGLTQTILAANRFTNPLTIPDSPIINPLTYSDMALWLDAMDPNGNGVLPAAGTAVARWVDKTDNQKSAFQLTVARRPTFNYDGDYPGIQFTGSNSHHLLGQTLLTTTTYGVFVVFRYTGGLGASNTTIYFHRKRTTVGNQNYIVMYASNTSELYSMRIQYSENTTPQNFISTSGTSTNNRTLFGIATDNTISETRIFYRNGTRLVTTTSGSTRPDISSDAEGYRLGVSNIGGTLSNYFTGFIHEVIVLLHDPTDLERINLEGYLAWKWGFQSSLPSTHPFRYIRPF